MNNCIFERPYDLLRILFLRITIFSIVLISGFFSCKNDQPDKKDATEVVMRFLVDGKLVKDANDMAGNPDINDASFVHQITLGNNYLIEDANVDLKNLSSREWYLVFNDDEKMLVGTANKFDLNTNRPGLCRLRLCYNEMARCTDRWINVVDHQSDQVIEPTNADEFNSDIPITTSNGTQTSDYKKVKSQKSDLDNQNVNGKSKIKDQNNYPNSDNTNTTGSNKSQTNQEQVQNKIAEEQRRKEEQQDIQRAEEERIKNEAQEKKSIKTEATPVIIEKTKPSSPKLIREGIVLQLSKESCITTSGNPSGGGSMKLSASMPIRLRGASVYASRDGRCTFTLTGPAGERGTLIKSLNAGTNAIRFSEWPHLILQNGETWILEFEGQGGVELYELNDCVKITGSELRPMNKMFLYNLTYYN